jgi:octaprenyl-diphosphate synthase
MATVMEFLHTATLVHDDIIDHADTRRNRPTVNALYGNETAVLMGDWLYMLAFETSLAERSLSILDILTRVTRKMTEGELLQLTLLGKAEVTEDEYLDVLERKTAYLFSSCCEIGSILGGAEERQQVALREYGLNLGTAFQLIDDLLDFTSSDDVLGKASGADTRGQGHAAFDLSNGIRLLAERCSRVSYAMASILKHPGRNSARLSPLLAPLLALGTWLTTTPRRRAPLWIACPSLPIETLCGLAHLCSSHDR